MSRIAVIVDSSTVLTQEMLEHPDVYVVNNKVIVDSKDVENFTKEDLNYALENGLKLQTSQPSIQEVHALFSEVLDKGYEHVFVLSLSKHLSGTYNGFELAARLSNDKRLEIIDSKTVTFAVGHMAQVMIEMSEENKSYQEMKDKLNELIEHTMAFLYPLNLKRLMLSGRVNKAVGTFSDLLKLKVVLILKNKGEQIEKFDIFRTESKAIKKMMETFKSFGVNSKDYIISLMRIDDLAPVERVKEFIYKYFPQIELKDLELPTVLATHGGFGVLAIQCIKK